MHIYWLLKTRCNEILKVYFYVSFVRAHLYVQTNIAKKNNISCSFTNSTSKTTLFDLPVFVQFVY